MTTKHLGIFWHPSATAEDVAAATKWAADAGTAVEIVVETDVNRARALATAEKERLAFVVAKAGVAKQQPSGQEFLADVLAQIGPHVFTILYSHTLSRDPASRLVVADLGVHMVSHVPAEVVAAIRKATSMPVLEARKAQPDTHRFACPICGIACLDERSLWEHMPMFHVAVKKQRSRVRCPICNVMDATIVVHVHDEHAPPGHPPDTSRSGIPLYSFGLVVIRRKSDGKFLVVQEYSSQGYWLPGGGIDAGEQPDVAAQRECTEEAGVAVKLTGILRIEVSPSVRHCRMRYIFYGEPLDEADCEPKTIPDFESAGACWVSNEEIASGRLRLRGDEPVEWFNYVAEGGTIHPIEMLTREGAPPPPVRRSEGAVPPQQAQNAFLAALQSV